MTKFNFNKTDEILNAKITDRNIYINCSVNSNHNDSSIKDVLSGGNYDMIDLIKLKFIIILAHGRIELDEKTVLTPEIHPTINVNTFPNVKNLAYIGIAPTGFHNVGSAIELEKYKSMIHNNFKKTLEEEIIKQKFTHKLQELENKINEVIDNKKSKLNDTPIIKSISDSSATLPPIQSSATLLSIPSSATLPPLSQLQSSATLPSLPKQNSFFSRVCNLCVNIIPSRKLVEMFLNSITSGEIVGYTFKGIFNICKSVLPNISLHGGTPKRKRKMLSSNKLLCSISSDVCISLLDGLRKEIKDFDSERFDSICSNLQSSPDFKSDISHLISNKDNRCRKLSVLKGFGSTTNLPFINKYLSYNVLTDKIMNMGVSILSFKINSLGKVKCIVQDINAEDLMRTITIPEGIIVDPHDPNNITYWCTMQDFISYCTEDNESEQTVVVIDLSCSTFPFTAYHPIESTSIGLSGGNKKKINLKKNYDLRKKTKKIINKSKNIKYIRNRRKYKNNTKKL